ncbi:TrlF family AAA-like ATPase [Clostridium sp. CMCC3677]|uniref:TrlF family AAA-like ATPase n=1 Tax=Clostridium sp. CMCC3677 TaxID=2949963 RepID=UPI0013F0BFCF|nr:PHP domain-containing protein [Clostridium sp. CMCC3677]NFG61365.1 PHP domain-containing protein [Clostridium botulinum]NFQ09164.1 PHP domain-containing protein [Clostridium botulinum]
MEIDYKGNRWYKCDLHLHTPASPCFRDKSVTATEFIKKVKEEGLECIAITDHNTAKWIDKIKEAAKDEDIIVFPGVELTCTEAKIHLIILFDINCTTQMVEDFILATKIHRNDLGTKNAHSSKTTKEILEIAKEHNGIVIPAHVDDYNGLCKLSYQIQEEVLLSDGIDVVQGINKELILESPNKKQIENLYKRLCETDKEITINDVKNYNKCIQLVKEKEKGIVTFSDNPESEGSSKHGLLGIGRSYTYIKMDENPTLNSLRQAFIFPKIRIKNCFSQCNKINKLPDTWIKKVKINDINTIGQSLEVEFNPQLTTIIGGRGSGKSTIVKILTGIFAQKNIVDFEDIYREFNNFYSIKDGVLKKSSEVELEIFKNNIKYKIVVKNFNDKTNPDILINKINELDGSLEEINDIKVGDLFKIDIYNQKQIYESAKNTNSLRNKIDSLIPTINNSKDKLNQYISDYKRQYIKIKDTEDKLKIKQRIKLSIDDISEKIDTYKKSGIKERLESYELYNKQRIALLSIYELMQNKEKELRKFVEEFKLESFKLNFMQDEYKDELGNLINMKNKEFSTIILTFEKQIEYLKKSSEEYSNSIIKTKWHEKYEISKSEYDAALEELRKKGIDVDTINKLLKEQEEKQKELNKLEEEEKKLSDEYQELEKIKESYYKIRNEITQLRKNYITQLLSDTNIRIKINQFKDIGDFSSRFREIIQKNTGFSELIKQISEQCFKGQVKEKINNLVKQFEEIKYTNKSNNNFNGKFINVIKDLNNEQMAALNLFLPEDDIQVEYQLNGSKSYKKLENASAGQKTSAILTFILSDGTVPLILDQPEDDLDNHLISELVVEMLKKCKEKRQIIVVTHNANIPVNGDSELTIAMNSDSKKIEIYKFGTIENDDIRTEICSVMEGGEDAFKLRAKRYAIKCNLI